MGGAGGACPGALLQLCRRPDGRQRHGAGRGSYPVLHRIPRRAVTGVQLLRTPLLWAAGCTVLLVRSPGLQLVLPGIPAAQATALAAVLMEGNV